MCEKPKMAENGVVAEPQMALVANDDAMSEDEAPAVQQVGDQPAAQQNDGQPAAQLVGGIFILSCCGINSSCCGIFILIYRRNIPETPEKIELRNSL